MILQNFENTAQLTIALVIFLHVVSMEENKWCVFFW